MSKELYLALLNTMFYSHYTISGQWWWLVVENHIGASAPLTLRQAIVRKLYVNGGDNGFAVIFSQVLVTPK